MADYSFAIFKDSTKPEARDRSLLRLREMLAMRAINGDENANAFYHGLIAGWAASEAIGLADADDLRTLLHDCPDALVGVPFGRIVTHPDCTTYTFENSPDTIWFSFLIGIKNDRYHFEQLANPMPQTSVFAWLGFLSGTLEGGSISQDDYDRLIPLLPPVLDDLTPILIATR